MKLRLSGLTFLVLLLPLLTFFSGVNSWFIKTSGKAGGGDRIDLLLAGDVYVGERMQKEANGSGVGGFTGGVESVLKTADLSFVNLEGAVTDKEQKWVDKEYTLSQDREVLSKLLDRLEVDGVSLANNHILDYGPSGLFETMSVLEQAGVKHVGAGATRQLAGAPVFFERRGRRVGFLAFSNTYPDTFWAGKNSLGTAFGRLSRVKSNVARVAGKTDHLVVSFHWGRELETGLRDYQQKLARTAVRAGADVVFGHHPHVIQPVEEYRGGKIFYSLGNYFFTSLTENVDYGLVVRVGLAPDGVADVEYHLLKVDNYQVGYRPEVQKSFSSREGLANFLEQFRYADDSDTRSVVVAEPEE